MRKKRNPIRQAKLSDAKEILRLVRAWAEKGKLLPRSLNDIYERIRDFFIYESADGKIMGVVSLAIVWEDLGEVRSLVVDEKCQDKGVGKELVKHCMNTAEEIGVKQLFALTYVPDFFIKLGFHEMNKQMLPHKIWSDCVRCHRFPDCDESAVAIQLGDDPASK
jgi:amino-acid N-acetyltransferase